MKKVKQYAINAAAVTIAGWLMYSMIVSLFVPKIYTEMKAQITDLTAEIERLKERQTQDSALFAKYTESVKDEFTRLENDIEQTTPLCVHENESVASIIRLICNRRDFDPDIAYAVALHESALNSKAVNINVNGTTDRGLYQFNDVFLDYYALTEEQAHDIVTATEYFIMYMKYLLDKYGGDLHYALRCYNAGEYGAEQGGGVAYADNVLKMLDNTKVGGYNAKND